VKSYGEAAVMVSQKQSYDKYKKTFAISFNTRQNRNSLKCQAKFSNINIASKSESKFLGI